MNMPEFELVSLETCRAASGQCSNTLISMPEWKGAIEHWVHEDGIAGRLRARLSGKKVLFHHALRISISGCPNACSRPQIADIGLVGFIHPSVCGDNCTACGACEAACPDAAITVDNRPPVFDSSRCQGCTRCKDACPDHCIRLSTPGARLLLGGRLGRHPHLAQVVASETEPAPIVRRLSKIVDAFLANSRHEERFADYLLRTRDC